MEVSVSATFLRWETMTHVDDKEQHDHENWEKCRCKDFYPNVDGLVQERRNSTANALE